MDFEKLKNNLLGTAKIYRYGLALLIPMVAVDAYKNGFEDTVFFIIIVLGYMPILAIKVFLYTYVEDLEFHKISKGVLWSFLSANVLVSSVCVVSFFEPPIITLNRYLLYVVGFTLLLFLNYFMLPWKET
ncbi:hypothetical protein KJI95_16250 [Shewanella sp. JM162201]|uniref:Uncharacterized protein n=1 Tax=Shewanella jiangmenensis TaxID=2837387 RepID=A0ABS5V7V9_9GAMM|nr:hypothetical protein [Shewanella jiangmenensis]MBT1446048.1 hypothetical protein [Shewanella jiangmenensis]